MRKRTKYIHVGEYVAEVGVNLIDSGDDWAPYLSVEDACKLDDVRRLLEHGDILAASKIAKVYRLTPVAHSQ